MRFDPLTLPAAALGLLAMSLTPAHAQTAQLCHEHGELRQALLERYHEVPVSIGLRTDGQLVQIFASAETGTWTILTARPDGIACVLAAGKHYEQRALPAPGPAAKAGEPDERAG